MDLFLRVYYATYIYIDDVTLWDEILKYYW